MAWIAHPFPRDQKHPKERLFFKLQACAQRPVRGHCSNSECAQICSAALLSQSLPKPAAPALATNGQAVASVSIQISLRSGLVSQMPPGPEGDSRTCRPRASIHRRRWSDGDHDSKRSSVVPAPAFQCQPPSSIKLVPICSWWRTHSPRNFRTPGKDSHSPKASPSNPAPQSHPNVTGFVARMRLSTRVATALP